MRSASVSKSSKAPRKLEGGNLIDAVLHCTAVALSVFRKRVSCVHDCIVRKYIMLSHTSKSHLYQESRKMEKGNVTHLDARTIHADET